MAGSFAFGFQSDDIEIDGDEVSESLEKPAASAAHQAAERVLKAKQHSLEEMLSTLPSAISYSSHEYNSPSSTIRLPRRELYDIRAQLMAEADLSNPSDTAVQDVSSDIKPQVYEGGFKTWECSIDLAMYLLRQTERYGLSDRAKQMRIVELGAGTALPTCAVLFHILGAYPTGLSSQNVHITVADYNPEVLSLASIPNILLTALFQPFFSPEFTLSSSGDLDTALSGAQEFSKCLQERGVTIDTVSGAWGDDFIPLIVGDGGLEGSTLILASETIYSPDSLHEFVRTLLSILGRGSQTGVTEQQNGERVALVAAKKMYFGVGGGVDEFVRAIESEGASVEKVWDSDMEGVLGKGKGVGRCIMEVKLLR